MAIPLPPGSSPLFTDTRTELTIKWLSQSQSYVTTDDQSASLSWNKVPIWGLRPDLYYCLTVAGLLKWGTLSDERTGLSFARVTAVISLLPVYTIYILHVIKLICIYMYVYTIYKRPQSVQVQYSRSSPNTSCSCYNGSLVTWTVVCLAAAKFKPLVFPQMTKLQTSQL
jgi:hypothetical protein